MNHKRKRKYDSDDIDDDDDDRIVQDGERVKVPISMMDSVQRSVALSRYMKAGQGHRPGYVTDDDSDARDAAEQSRAEYIRYLEDAHRTAATDDYADHDEPPSRPTGLRDAKREAEAAYQEYVRYLTDAHKGGRP